MKSFFTTECAIIRVRRTDEEQIVTYYTDGLPKKYQTQKVSSNIGMRNS